MIKIFKCNDSNYINKLIKFLDKRRDEKNNDVKKVSLIIKDIKKNKTKALLKYEKQFSKNKNIKPSKKRINQSINQLDPKVKKAIDFAYDRILKFHSKQLKSIENIIYKDKFSNKLEYRSVPIESVAIYVPGNLPSTLLMNSIPAKLAKVKRLVLATPKINGKLNPAVLYAAKKVGINEIWNFGGAQAIASLAYIQKVNKIVGPGNRFVAEAKRQLSGKVIGTESMFAGPSEICVLADKYSDVDQVTTSLISQAEHDIDSQCIMITKDKKLINKVKKRILELLKKLPRKKIAYRSLKNHGLIIKVKSDKQIINVINTISPEHVELLVKNYTKYTKKIINAGSICNGKYSPMCASDFTVGTNHVLPTLGSARFSSGLNINEFIKKISVVTLSKLGVEKIANQAITLSEFEELFGHAQSIKSRIRRK
jgi:histidinol dehydrogenase